MIQELLKRLRDVVFSTDGEINAIMLEIYEALQVEAERLMDMKRARQSVNKVELQALADAFNEVTEILAARLIMLNGAMRAADAGRD